MAAFFYCKRTVLHAPKETNIEPEKDSECFFFQRKNHLNQTSMTWVPAIFSSFLHLFKKSLPWIDQEPTEMTPQLTGTQKAKELNRALRRLVLGANGMVNAADRSLGETVPKGEKKNNILGVSCRLWLVVYNV